jgi:hypothetical protein
LTDVRLEYLAGTSLRALGGQRKYMGYTIFLGAGASKAFGFPLTAEILPKIRSLLLDGELFGSTPYDAQQEKDLGALLKSVFPGIDEITDGGLPLVTEVLSLVDYSLISSSVSSLDLSRKRLDEFRRLLERAVVATLDWPYQAMNVPACLKKFGDWIQYLIRSGESVSIISTNYDISVENELFRGWTTPAIEDHFDFGIEWRDPSQDQLHPRPKDPACRIYKLHGSLNWLHCPLCDHIYINTKGSIIHQAFREERVDANTCDCGYWPLDPLIVAPSSVRDVRNSNLMEIWRHSLEAMRRANKWIIIGYSFPPEDIAIRSMFQRAYSSSIQKPIVKVVQFKANLATEGRYRIIFPGCEYETGGMEAFVNGLAAPTLSTAPPPK